MTNSLLIIAAVCTTTIFMIHFDEVLALEKSKDFNIKIITKGDLYVESKTPIKVPFQVKAISSLNTPVLVECDKTENSIFKVGKTTVRCIAIDSFGNETRSSFVVTVGYNIVQIPNWFKHTTNFWNSQNTSDEEYIQALNFLLEKKIINVPYAKSPKNDTSSDIPIWIKTNAKKWGKGELSNDEFSIGIQWMLSKGKITV